MKRFKWRLQRVLDIKKKEEQVKRAELVDITEQLSQAHGQLFMQKRILEDLIDSVSQAHPQEQLSRQEFFMAHSGTNDMKIKKLEKDIKTFTARQKEKIAEILKIKQFNEGLEKLRAEAEIKFVSDQEKLEQKDMDEAAVFRFARQIMT